MTTYNLGSLLRFETEVLQANTAFGEAGYSPHSPATVTITIEDAAGVEQISAATMTESATGEFYYDAQTLTSWDYSGACKATMLSGTVVIGVEKFKLS